MGGVNVTVKGTTIKIGAKPKVIDAKESPHYQKRGDMRAMSEEEGRAIVRKGGTDRDRERLDMPPPKDGQVVGVRPNLNVHRNTGVWMLSMHEGHKTTRSKKSASDRTTAENLVIGNGVAVTVRDAVLTVNQRARANIATGKTNKFPMSSVDGKFVAKPGADQFDGIELRFNPHREHVYVDPDGRPVKMVEEATVVGTGQGARVFARGRIEYFDESDYPQPLDGVPTAAQV